MPSCIKVSTKGNHLHDYTVRLVELPRLNLLFPLPYFTLSLHSYCFLFLCSFLYIRFVSPPHHFVLFFLELPRQCQTIHSSSVSSHIFTTTTYSFAFSVATATRSASSAVCPAKSPPAGLDFLKSESTNTEDPKSTSSSLSQTTDGS